MKSNEPRILFLDIETLANLPEIMQNLTRLYEGATMKANHSSVITFGYKWLGDAKPKTVNAWDFSRTWARDVNDDSEVLKRAHEILGQADQIVGHYSRKFDLKFLNTRFMRAGLAPYTGIPHVDTCQLAKSKLLLSSNRLDAVAKYFGLPQKLENGGWQLWVDVLARKPAAQRLMSRYCAQDVEVLEKVYLKLRPFMAASGAVTYSDFSGKQHSCPSCGSTKLQKHGRRVTKRKVVQRFLCSACGTSSHLLVSKKESRLVR